MIIDIHAHPLSGHPLTKAPLTAGECAALMLEQMQLGGVSRAALLGHPVYPGQTIGQIRAVNDFTAEVIAAAPEHFFGMAFINPALAEADVVAELERALSLPGFLAIKLEIDLNCRDPRLDAVAAVALRHNVPILHHTWYLNMANLTEEGREYQKDRSEPHDVAHLARRFPDLNIIMAHLEGSGIRGLTDIADCPNVWVDTSGSLPFSGTLEYGVELLGAERILFGSDLPYRSYETQLARVLGSGLSLTEQAQILHLNAARLFPSL